MTLVLALACAPDLSKDRPMAEVQPAAPAAEAPAAQPNAAQPNAAQPSAPQSDELVVPKLSSATILQVDKAQSKVGALGAKITATHPVDFHEFAGNVGMDGDKVTGVAFAAKIASLESDHPKLTEHLKGEDFLWAERFPLATFASTAITPGGEGGHTHTITGDLSIRGKTVAVKFPATIEVAPNQVSAKTEFVINRKDFDVVYPGKPDDLVQDNVVMKINLVAARANQG
jgi:polyisoprenoid-binding protein YceI